MADTDPTKRPPGEPVRPPVVPDEREVPPPPPINEPSPPPPPQAGIEDADSVGEVSEEVKRFGDAAALDEGPAGEAVDRATSSLGDDDPGKAADRMAGEISYDEEFDRDEDIGDGTNRTGFVDERRGYG